MGNKLKILVTGAGAPGGPGIIKSLKSIENFIVYGADIDINATGKYLVDNFFQISRPEEKNFISNLLEICLNNGINVIVPLVTKELFVLSKSRDDFKKNGIKILVSENRALHIANDKANLYQTLSDSDVLLPDFRIVKTKEDLIAAVQNLGYPANTVVIKPARGNGSRGIRIINSNKDRYDLLFNEKPSSLYSSLDDYLDAIGDKPIPDLVVSEFLPGEEVTVDCLVVNDSAKVILVRERDSIREGISVAGHFIRSKEIEEQVKTIISKIPGLFGPIGFQFKKSYSGNFGLLESNPRLQGTCVAALGLGYNIPQQSINICMDQNIDLPSRLEGIYFRRYYSEIFYE